MLTKSRMTENMKHLTTQKDFFSKPQMADSVKYWQWPALLVTTWYKLNYSGPEGRPIVMGHFRLCKHDYVLSGRSTNHKSNPWKYRNGVSISQYLYFLPLLNIPRDNWKCVTTKNTLHLRKKMFSFLKFFGHSESNVMVLQGNADPPKTVSRIRREGDKNIAGLTQPRPATSFTCFIHFILFVEMFPPI